MDLRRFLLSSAIVPLAALVLAGSAAAESPAELVQAPATQPAERPIDREIRALIIGLGDPDPAIRDKSAAKLKAMGKDALPALKDAATLEDPEISGRAQALVRQIERKELPIGPATPGRSNPVRMSTAEGVRTIVTTTERRKVSIQENADGAITMDVTAIEKGKETGETVQVKAKNAEELKAENPEAYALYEKYVVKNNVNPFAGGVGGGGQVRVMVQGGNGPGMLPPPMPPNNQPNNVVVQADPLDAYQVKLQEAFAEAKAPEETRKEILADLAKVRELKMPKRRQNKAEAAKRQEEYFAASDKLRAKLAENKLPDPGDVLPPPAGQRLGLELRPRAQAPLFGGGPIPVPVVQQVSPNSRAEKVGLQADDEIDRVNDWRVTSIEEIQKLAGEEKPLTFKVIREGKPIELAEKKPEREK